MVPKLTARLKNLNGLLVKSGHSKIYLHLQIDERRPQEGNDLKKEIIFLVTLITFLTFKQNAAFKERVKSGVLSLKGIRCSR